MAPACLRGAKTLGEPITDVCGVDRMEENERVSAFLGGCQIGLIRVSVTIPGADLDVSGNPTRGRERELCPVRAMIYRRRGLLGVAS